MPRSAHDNPVVVVRSGLRVPVGMICIAVVIFLIGLLALTIGPALPLGFVMTGAAAALAGVGCLRMKYRRPWVCLTAGELRLPGFRIPPIPWGDVARAGVFESRPPSVSAWATSSFSYLGIELTAPARERVKQPRLVAMLGASVKADAEAASGYDLILDCGSLEWASERLAGAIKKRASGAATPAAR